MRMEITLSNAISVIEVLICLTTAALMANCNSFYIFAWADVSSTGGSTNLARPI